MKVRKAVIVAAGMGTRMLPASKVIPKEILPVVDKPAIQMVVEEAVASGIEEIILVLSPGRTTVLEHFQSAPELERLLEQRLKHDLLEVRSIYQWARPLQYGLSARTARTGPRGAAGTRGGRRRAIRGYPP
jgi:UTP--glucose-1-phosphate uridylyltransferase